MRTSFIMKISKLKKRNLVFLSIIIYNLYQSAAHLLNKDLLFHTDIARDFLLMEQLVFDRKLMMIGPRAGGISGVFYSPLWYYINAPFFAIGKGNPLVVGYFWLILIITCLVTTFIIVKKLFGDTTAFLVITIYSFELIQYSRGFTLGFGSILLSPILFYLINLFVAKKNYKILLLAVLVDGFIICFQPAFGIITTFTTLLLIVFFSYRDKNWKYLTAVSVLVLPLSTYIIFEVRHKFLQSNAFVHYLINPPNQEYSLIGILQNRIEQFLGRINLAENTAFPYTLLFLVIYVVPLFFIIKGRNKQSKEYTFLRIFYFYFAVFWLITFLFKGIIWDYYHMGFLPILITIFVLLHKLIHKYLFYTVYFGLLLYLLLHFWNLGIIWNKSFADKNSSSWKLNRNVAEYIFADSSTDFGYFVFSPDQFGYSIKYAINYFGRTHIDKKGYLCKKMENTYLIYEPYKNDANEYKYWKNKRLHVYDEPISSNQIGQILVEKYLLEGKSLNEKADPNLVCDLIFR